MIYYHNINPVLISIFGFDIYYYSLAYLFGAIFIPYFINKKYLNDKKLMDSYSMYILLGTVLGGRLGYILLYDFSYYLASPWKIFNLREGGMAFHGGMIGYMLGNYLFSRKYGKNWLKILDISMYIVPICLFFGRILNFINGELYGRLTDGTWGVIFPGDYHLRHPSQLYEAFFEGFIGFFLLSWVYKKYSAKVGFTSGFFLIIYGIARFFVEFFREPDVQVGYIAHYFTLGQILCVVMVIFGIFVARKCYISEKI